MLSVVIQWCQWVLRGILRIAMKDFGKRLRALRNSMNISGPAVADKIGMNYSYFAKIERGGTPNPTLETRERIASGLGLSLRDFETRLEAINVEQADSVEHRTRVRRIQNQVLEVKWNQDREDGISAILEKWSKNDEVD